MKQGPLLLQLTLALFAEDCHFLSVLAVIPAKKLKLISLVRPISSCLNSQDRFLGDFNSTDSQGALGDT